MREPEPSNASRRVVRAVLAGALLLIAASAFATARSETRLPKAAAQPTPAQLALFGRYEEALNRHDHTAVSAFWKPGVTRTSGGKRLSIDRSRWRGYREFEAAMHAVFSINARALGGDAFEVTQREDCDFYRALGSDTKTTVFVVHLDGERIADVEPGPGSDSGIAYAPALDDLKGWIVRRHPERAAELLSNGALVFDGRSAEGLLELAREWRATQMPAGEPAP